MTLSVASRRIDRPHGLSDQARLVLGFVDGGRHWLEWAIHDPHARYHFEDENALVAGVQTGLHDSGLALLPKLGLWVSPVKLMTLSPADLRTLARAEEPSASAAPVRVRRILADHHLVPASELADLIGFLGELEVDKEPLFHGAALGEQLAVLGLRDPDEGEPAEIEFQCEAAAFALEQSRTPLEFADYYCAYLGLAAAETGPKSRKQRKAHAERALATLLPLMFNALDCPRVDGLAAPWEVSAAIEEWLMMGRRLGFARLSQAVQQMIAYSGFGPEGEDEAAGNVAAYLADAQSLLASAELDGGQVGQDGVCTFRARSPAHEAVVLLGPDGLITLGSFRRLPQEPAAPSTSTRRKKDG